MKTILLIAVSVFVLTSCKPPQTENKAEAEVAKANCVYIRNEKDPVGKPILMVEDALFISLAKSEGDTSRQTTINNDFLKGYLSCVRVDTVLGIYFDLKIYSLEAYRDYGMIRKDNKISFILSNGKSVTVPFAETFSGNTNLTAELTEYKTFSRISREDAALLKSAELGRVIISWSKMEEEYKVVNPGIFMKQIPCVE